MITKKIAYVYSKNSYQCNEVIAYLILREVLNKDFYLNTNERSEIDGYILSKGERILIENKIRINDSINRYETSICEAKKIDKIINSDYINHNEVWILTYYFDGILLDRINDIKENNTLIFYSKDSYVHNFGDKSEVLRTNYVFKTKSQSKIKIDLSYYIELSKKYCYECNGNLINSQLENLIIETIS